MRDRQLPPELNLEGYTEIPWSSCGKPKAFFHKDKGDYQMMSWTRGISAKPLIEDPLGPWFSQQAVSVFYITNQTQDH